MPSVASMVKPLRWDGGSGPVVMRPASQHRWRTYDSKVSIAAVLSRSPLAVRARQLGKAIARAACLHSRALRG